MVETRADRRLARHPRDRRRKYSRLMGGDARRSPLIAAVGRRRAHYGI